MLPCGLSWAALGDAVPYVRSETRTGSGHSAARTSCRNLCRRHLTANDRPLHTWPLQRLSTNIPTGPHRGDRSPIPESSQADPWCAFYWQSEPSPTHKTVKRRDTLIALHFMPTSREPMTNENTSSFFARNSSNRRVQFTRLAFVDRNFVFLRSPRFATISHYQLARGDWS